jgi:hypothetical protein
MCSITTIFITSVIMETILEVTGAATVGDQGPEPRLRMHCSHWAYCTPCFLEVPTVAARCLHVLRDARDPSREVEI